MGFTVYVYVVVRLVLLFFIGVKFHRSIGSSECVILTYQDYVFPRLVSLAWTGSNSTYVRNLVHFYVNIVIHP